MLDTPLRFELRPRISKTLMLTITPWGNITLQRFHGHEPDHKKDREEPIEDQY